MPRRHGGRLRRLGSLGGACFIVGVLALSTVPLAGVAAAQQSDEASPSELLAACACRPADESLFIVYNPGVPYPPVPDPGLSPAQVEARAREQLETVMEARDPSLLPRAEAVFGDPSLTGTIRHPSLRAGLAMLVGTFAESLIDVYRDPALRAVRFRTSASDPDAHAEAVSFLDGSQEVWVNPVAEHELPGQFTTMLAHEALHVSGLTVGENGRPEEATLHLVDALVHSVMIRDQPQLALGRTRVGVDLATNVLGIVFNSRSMTEGRDPELFPGAGLPDWDNFYEDVPHLRAVPDRPSSGDDPLTAVLTALGLADVAANPAFDRDADGTPDYSRSLVESLELDRILDAGRVLSASDLRQVAATLTISLPADTRTPSVDTEGQTSVTLPASPSGPAQAVVTTTPTTTPVPVELTTATDAVNEGAAAVRVGGTSSPAVTGSGSSAAPGTLARTGRNLATGFLLAVVLLMSGALFVRASRSRGSRPSP